MRILWTIVIALVSTIALAHSDGIYNPASNSVGSFEGIDSNAATAGAAGKLLLADGVSHVLQTDGTSKVCLAGGC